MATPRNKSLFLTFPNSTVARWAKVQEGWDTAKGQPRTPLPYSGYEAKCGPQILGLGPPVTDYTKPAHYANSLLEFRDWAGLPPWAQGAMNRAYGRFREKALGESSALGTLFAEWKEALGMVEKRALGLYHAYRHLRKGRFRKFLRSLSVKPMRKHRSKIHNTLDEASGLWLEYWFGWSPTLQDIYKALQVLGMEFNPLPVKGRATASTYFTNRTGYQHQSYQRSISHLVGGEVHVSNPNAFILNKLGLANPVAVMWEVIPFSFLVDWVFDVGSFIESFSDWVGCDVIRPYHNHFLRYHDQQWFKDFPGGEIPSTVNNLTGVAQIRSLGLYRPIPSLTLTGNLGTSSTRAATAVSLLLQVFTGGLDRLAD